MPAADLVVPLTAVLRLGVSEIGQGDEPGRVRPGWVSGPPGYCLTTTACRRHLTHHNLIPLTVDTAIAAPPPCAGEGAKR